MPSGACQYCGVFRKWLHRHHVKPRSEGGTDADGIDLICANCHEDVHGSPFGATHRAKQRRAEREKNIPKEELYRLYVVEKWSIRRIAKHYGTASSNIHYWLNDYGIEMRPMGRYGKLVRPPIDELRGKLSSHTQAEVARMYEVTPSAVVNWRKFYKIDLHGNPLG